MRIVSLLLTGALATTFAVLLCTYALLDTAPKPWDEAFLLSLPTRPLAKMCSASP